MTFNTGSYWEFIPLGAETVHALIVERDKLIDPLGASLDNLDQNAFMDLSKHSISIAEVRENLSDIAHYVETNNQLDLPTDQRTAVVTELNSLQKAIECGSVRIMTLANSLSQTGAFQFLKEKVPDKAIGSLISAVVGHIARWLGLWM